ncbi:hypothetical protein ACFLT9_06945 [Acidobacteriota bacterium]
MDINIRKKIPSDIFDYQALSEALTGYAYPRDKISDLMKKKIIVRIKKGLYIFGETLRQNPIPRELLANLIYGPSYVSLEYALHFHGLTPERSEALTSVCLGRSRQFSTPLGLFVYRSIPLSAYQIGMLRMETEQDRAFLMASPDKALADKIVTERGTPLASQKDVFSFLTEDLRVDSSILPNLDPKRIYDFADSFRSRKLRLLGDLVKRLQNKHQGASNE